MSGHLRHHTPYNGPYSLQSKGYPLDGSMIPCYFTLEELKHMHHCVSAYEDRYEEGDKLTFAILENLDSKISNEERINANR